MLTEKQLAANRANALKSTGPRSASGKARSARNAKTHGLFQPIANLTGRDLNRFNRLSRAYRNHYRPSDDVETDIVGQMIQARWRYLLSQKLLAGFFDQKVDDCPVTNREINRSLARAIIHDVNNAYGKIQRTESSALRAYDRALLNLSNYRENKNVETNPFPSLPKTRAVNDIPYEPAPRDEPICVPTSAA